MSRASELVRAIAEQTEECVCGIPADSPMECIYCASVFAPDALVPDADDEDLLDFARSRVPPLRVTFLDAVRFR